MYTLRAAFLVCGLHHIPRNLAPLQYQDISFASPCRPPPPPFRARSLSLAGPPGVAVAQRAHRIEVSQAGNAPGISTCCFGSPRMRPRYGPSQSRAHHPLR